MPELPTPPNGSSGTSGWIAQSLTGVTRVGGVEDPFDHAVVAREDVEAERAWALVHPVEDGLDGVDLEDR